MPAEQRARDLLDMSLKAAAVGDDERALELLQRSVDASHATPAAHYLLGADYAQRQRYGDAVVHLTTAVEQAPELWTARLQLGLLWLTLANPAAAVAQLRPLSALPENDASRCFGNALIALATDDLMGAKRHLSGGLQLGTASAALQADMQRVLAAIEARTPVAMAAAGPMGGELATSLSHGLAISAYAARESGA